VEDFDGVDDDDVEEDGVAGVSVAAASPATTGASFELPTVPDKTGCDAVPASALPPPPPPHATSEAAIEAPINARSESCLNWVSVCIMFILVSDRKSIFINCKMRVRAVMRGNCSSRKANYFRMPISSSTFEH
jgi:hypothetical protein